MEPSLASSGRSGFALVLVLWTLLLVAALTQSLMLEVRTSRSVASDEVASFEDGLLLDSALNRALAALLDERDQLRLPLDGSCHSVGVLGREVEVCEQAEMGKIDLNLSPSDLLERLFRHLGTSDPEALARDVVAWRGRSPMSQQQEVTDRYRAAGRKYLPRFGPFRSIGEVGLVIGMDDRLMRDALPFLTIWSGNGIVDRSLASGDLLQILSDDGDKLAESQRSARAAGQAAGEDRGIALGDVVTITARLISPTSKRTRVVTVQIVSGSPVSFRVLAWR